MGDDELQLAIQTHLAEYGALRQEMLEMIKWREQIVFLSLGISGALLSFSFSSDQNASNGLVSRHIALYRLAPCYRLRWAMAGERDANLSHWGVHTGRPCSEDQRLAQGTRHNGRGSRS
jgi:hypothetical protein